TRTRTGTSPATPRTRPWWSNWRNVSRPGGRGTPRRVDRPRGAGRDRQRFDGAEGAPMTRTALALVTLAALAPPAAAAERTNFVFLFADDQRYDALGVVQREQGDRGRFPWFKTPNMDRIAAEGVRFRNAFVVNSLCSPSRACFL